MELPVTLSIKRCPCLKVIGLARMCYDLVWAMTKAEGN